MGDQAHGGHTHFGDDSGTHDGMIDGMIDGGLGVDLPGLLGRRRLLTVLAGTTGALLLGACSDDEAVTLPSTTLPPPTTEGAGAASSTTEGTLPIETLATPPANPVTPTTDAGPSGECELVPEETAGPFPGDGSNGPDVLSEAGVVRSDITASIGAASGVADGIPTSVEFVLLDADGCTPLAGAAVYAWHCDRLGRYSMYSEGVEGENYLRGVQESDADGVVRFQTIFPGCYPGRWPHIHFEVYPSLADATSVANVRHTSQLAFPLEACEAAYATAGYEASVESLLRISLASDGVFGDDAAAQQLATVTGDAAAGFAATLTIAV